MPLSVSPEEIDKELIDDFFLDFTERYERSEEILIALEQTPKDKELGNELFRAVHTIKGNLIYIGLTELCPLLQSIEDILEQLRSGELLYNDLLSDVVLLAMDKTKQLVDRNLYKAAGASIETGEHFDNICHAIHQITETSEADRPQMTYQAARLLDPNTKLPPPEQQVAFQNKKDESFLLQLPAFGVEEHPDLSFIQQLIPSIEERSPYWQGHTYRITKLSLKMNQQAGNPVDPSQLAMAGFIHDMAMAFLPLQLLHKGTPFNSQDKRNMHGHVRMSYDILHKMGGWEDAAEIVLQHHEHCNGEGYPKGLKEAEICAGAKILAIADTFDACRYSRAYRIELKRPLIRAILEINRQADTQFSRHWVDIFNSVAKNNFTAH